MSKFDCIVALGCSFVAGSNINDSDGNFVGDKYRASKLLSEHFKCEEFNLAHPGYGNESIISSGYNWIRKNIKFKKPLFLIGTSGLSRERIWSNYSKKYWDLHLFDFPEKHTSKFNSILNSRVDKISGPDSNPLLLEHYVDIKTKYMFDFEQERKKLCQNIILFDSFLAKHNYENIFFNSLTNDISEITGEINYMTFNVDSNKDTPIRRDDIGVHYKFKPIVEDCWYHSIWKEIRLSGLYDQHKFNEHKLYDITKNNKPPYGEYLCGGHPSPGANKTLANKVLKYIDENNI